MLFKNKKTIFMVFLLGCFTSPTFTMFKVLRNFQCKFNLSKFSCRLNSSAKWLNSNRFRATGLTTAAVLASLGANKAVNVYNEELKLCNERSYVSGTTSNDMLSLSTILDTKVKLLKSKNLNLGKSQSFYEVHKLLGIKLDENQDLDTQLKQYRECIRMVVEKYYGYTTFVTLKFAGVQLLDLLYYLSLHNFAKDKEWFPSQSEFLNKQWANKPVDKKTVDQVVDTVVLFSLDEALYQDTHFVFYTGTQLFPSLLFRTALDNQFKNRNNKNFFLLRDPGVNKGLEKVSDVADYMKSFRTLAEHEKNFYDSHPSASRAFISANVFLMGNSMSPDTFVKGAYTGSCSLSFLTKLNVCANLFYSMLAKLPHEVVGQVGMKNVDFVKRTFQAHGLEKCWDEYKQRVSTMCAPLEASGNLIRVLVPKEFVRNKRAFLAKRGGASLDVDLFNYLGGEYRKYDANALDASQARVALDPSWFEDPNSGIKMDMVVLGDPKVFKDFFEKNALLVNELKCL